VAFLSDTTISSGQCLNNMWTANPGNATCPAAVPANTLTTVRDMLLGPIPAGGATVTNLEVVTTATGTATNTATIDVINNTTGLIVLSCTINNTSLSTKACQNTGAGFVAGGSYLQVKVTTTGTGMNVQYRAAFRY